MWSKTWHTTLLAQVGKECNAEGPLPWIERDYTPVSTAHDWEQGRCDILIKVYLEPPGLATSWLHRFSTTNGAGAGGGAVVDPADGAGDSGSLVWLSVPMRTMYVPSLALDEQDINRKHAGILLLVAGTGVVAVPQVLHHANKATCFGVRPPVTQPVSVIYSCRSDDVLMIRELADWCRDGQLQRCTVLTTDAQPCAPVFPEVADADVDAAFAGLGNAACAKARLSLAILQTELGKMQGPLRVVVSGPEGFNKAAKSMLEQSGVHKEALTILSA